MWLLLRFSLQPYRYMAVARTCCVFFLGMLLNNFSIAEELMVVEPSIGPVFQWEQDFKMQTCANDIEREDAYRNLLHKVQDHLASQNIAVDFFLDYTYTDYGHARLRIKPPRQKPAPHTPYDLIHLAYDLDQVGLELEYGTIQTFLDPDYFQQEHQRYKPVIHNASHKWYFNGRVLNHFAELVQNDFFKRKLSSFEKLSADPTTEDVFTHFLIGYLNYQNLTVDLTNSFPYLALLIDEARQIYIPHRTLCYKTPKGDISTPWAFLHYETILTFGETAQALLKQYPSPAPQNQQELRRLIRAFFGFQEEFSLKMIDLNALLYILTERPEHVRFFASEKHPGVLNVFANEAFSNTRFSYAIKLHWPQEVLANGDTPPIYTSTVFQIFYRYHLDLFHRLLKIKHILLQQKKAGSTAVVDFLQALIHLSERSPHLIGKMVHYHPWNYDQLRFFMQQAQKLAVADMKIVKEKRDLHNALRLQEQCAPQVLPPQNKMATNSR